MGGARGVGRSVAKKLAMTGAYVVVFDRDGAAGDDLISSLAGGGHLFVVGDMASESDIAAFSKIVISQYGRVDGMVNCSCSEELIRNSNVSGVSGSFAPCTARRMLAGLLSPFFSAGASIVNISHVRATFSRWETAHKSNAAESPSCFSRFLEGRGVRVNHLIPVSTAGEAHISSENDHADRIAQAGVFLCSEHASAINHESIIVDEHIPFPMSFHRLGEPLPMYRECAV